MGSQRLLCGPRLSTAQSATRIDEYPGAADARSRLVPPMNETETAFLVLRVQALLSENEIERDRLLNEISRRLGVEGECDLATITNLAAEGTDTAARFPVSQDGLRDAIRPIWTSRMGELFLIPGSS